MKMQYSVVQDPCLSQEVLDQVDSILKFYRDGEKHPVPFHENFNSDTKLITKVSEWGEPAHLVPAQRRINLTNFFSQMGRSLLPKFPRDQDERLWRHIRSGVLGEKHSSLPDPLISHAAFGADAAGAANGLADAVNGFDLDEEEEEIDDDEDGALMMRGRGAGRRGSRSGSAQSGGGAGGSIAGAGASGGALRGRGASALAGLAGPAAPTDEVISLLLQRQAPVAPMAHGASAAAQQRAAPDEDEEAPLDFSTH